MIGIRLAGRPLALTGWIASLAFATLVGGSAPALAVTPNSPEVKAMIEKGITFLAADNSEDRLGGKCVVALALIKNGVPHEHPKVQLALKACREIPADREASSQEGIYSAGLAIIFLCEENPKANATLINEYMKAMEKVQKPHGGWGYYNRQTGDTSMTQYGCLSSWTAKQADYKIQTASIERVANWLIRTQDPDGSFGYQGNDPGPNGALVPQLEKSITMTAAALGSLLICANLLGQVTVRPDDIVEDIPAVLHLVQDKKDAAKVEVSDKVDVRKLRTALANGDAWLKKTGIKADPAVWPFYYLYALERYMSFRELLEGSGKPQAEPAWYNEGYAYLKSKVKPDGHWEGPGRPPVETAFALLFLCRSTKKSIDKVKAFGPGTLVGGRGLPSNVKDVTLKRGSIVATHVSAGIDDLLKQLSDPSRADDEVTENPDEMVLSDDPKVRATQVTRLRQLVHAGSPEARVAATKALGRAHNLKEVPTLIYAMSDPDRRVVVAAADGLNFVSRKFDGFALPEGWNEGSRQEAIEKWKSWFLSIQPDANFEN